MGYDSVALLKNSAYVWAFKNHDGSEEMKILNDLIQKEKVIVIDVEDDDRMIIEYAIAENGLILLRINSETMRKILAQKSGLT